MKRFTFFTLFVLSMLVSAPGVFAQWSDEHKGFFDDMQRDFERNRSQPPPINNSREEACLPGSGCYSRLLEQRRHEEYLHGKDHWGQMQETDRYFREERRHNEHMDLLREQNRYLYGR